MRKLTAIALVAVLAVLVAAVGAGAQENDRKIGTRDATDPAPGGPFSGEIAVGRGSDTTFNVSNTLGSIYTSTNSNSFPMSRAVKRTENRNGDVVVNTQAEGSSVGIAQLADYADLVDDGDQRNDRQTAFARSSREPRDTDPAGLRFTSFALDGIVPVTFGAQGGPSEGVDNLTVEQLRGIFVDCTITNFNQIGGDDAEIEVYAIQEGSGTRATFDAFLGGDTSNCADEDQIIFENNANPILQADSGVDPEDRGRAIFPFSFARLSTSVPSDAINTVAVNGTAASIDTISDESFPFTRDVFFVTAINNRAGDDPAGNAAADRFVNFVCKPNSQHSNDPITGDNYGKVIDDAIAGNGFGLKDCENTDTE